MSTKKILTIIISLILLSSRLLAQSPTDKLKIYSTTTTYKSVFVQDDDDFTKYSNGIDFVTKVIGLTPGTSQDGKDLQAILAKYKDLNTGSRAVILVKHPYDPTKNAYDTKSLIYSIIKGENPDDQYLLNIKNILVIFIASKADNSFDNVSVTVTNLSSRLKSTALDLIKLVQATLTSASKDIIPGEEPLQLKILELTAPRIKPPANITIKYPDLTSAITIADHERSYWNFQAGVSANQVDQNSFNISNGVLTVAPTSSQKQQWKGNIIAMIVFNPWGQDFDRMGELFSKPPQGITSMFAQRIGLFAGVNISSDPIQTIYTGLNFTYSKSIFFNLGYSFVSEVETGKTYNVGNITSVSGLESYLSRQYKGKFFLGISFSPSQMLSNIGSSQSSTNSSSGKSNSN